MDRTATAVETVQQQVEAVEARLSAAVEGLRTAVAAGGEEDTVLTARSQAVAAGVDATNARLASLAAALGELERRLESEAATVAVESAHVREALRKEHAQREAAAERAAAEAQRFREGMRAEWEGALSQLELTAAEARAEVATKAAPASLEGEVRTIQVRLRENKRKWSRHQSADGCFCFPPSFPPLQAALKATAQEVARLRKKVAAGLAQAGPSVVHYGAAVGAHSGAFHWQHQHAEQASSRMSTPPEKIKSRPVAESAAAYSMAPAAPAPTQPFRPVVFFRHSGGRAAAPVSPTATATTTASSGEEDDDDSDC